MKSRSKSLAKPAKGAFNPLLLDSQLCFALYSTSLAMNKVYRKLLGGLDLTYPQYRSCWCCGKATDHGHGHRRTPVPGFGHADAAAQAAGSGGLVSRNRAQADERQVIVALTRQGRELRERAEAVPHAIAAAAQCSLDEAQDTMRALHGLREKLVASL